MTMKAYDIRANRLTPDQIEETLGILAEAQGPLALALRELSGQFGQAVDSLTHGHGGFDLGQLAEIEAALTGALPSGIRAEYREAQLGEHQTRALGARTVTLTSEQGESCVAEWDGSGTKIARHLVGEFDPAKFGLELLFRDEDGAEWYSAPDKSLPNLRICRKTVEE